MAQIQPEPPAGHVRAGRVGPSHGRCQAPLPEGDNSRTASSSNRPQLAPNPAGAGPSTATRRVASPSEVDVALYSLHHLLRDHALVTQRNDCLPLGVEQLAAQTLVARRAFLDAIVVISVVASSESVRAEPILPADPLGGVFVHPILTGELLEPGESCLGCLDPCLRILPLGAAVASKPSTWTSPGRVSTCTTSVPRMTTNVMNRMELLLGQTGRQCKRGGE